MNKNDFNSYLCTIMAATAAQHKGCTKNGLSQHTIIPKKMRFGSMMCKTMMS